MKKVYEPKEWVDKQVNKDKWFDYDFQDQWTLEKAWELYIENDGSVPSDFDDYLDEATQLLRSFYNYRFNPATRKPR